MNSEDIRIDAQLLTGFQIKDVTNFVWVKDAVNYIVRTFPNAATKKTVTFEATKGSVYQVEEEFIQLDKISRVGKRRPLTPPEYECDEFGVITFYIDGDVEISYKYNPPLPQTITDKINIPDRFAEPIKYYISARQRGRVYGSSDAEAQQYDSLFQTYLEQADVNLSRANKKHRRMPARF